MQAEDNNDDDDDDNGDNDDDIYDDDNDDDNGDDANDDDDDIYDGNNGENDNNDDDTYLQSRGLILDPLHDTTCQKNHPLRPYIALVGVIIHAISRYQVIPFTPHMKSLASFP
jgi:hypothetical protein